METQQRRKNYFIDPSFQRRFILKFCVVVLISSLLSGGLIFLFSQNSNTVAIENTQVVVKRTADFILPLVALTILIVCVFSALVVLILTLLISHKISGPLYRFRKSIECLKEGDFLTNFKIREKDQLQELARGLSGMCEALKQKHIELNNKWNALKIYLQEKNLPISDEEKARLSKMQEEINEVLKYFKV
jgi:methyl-accepting chemotaxis protein